MVLKSHTSPAAPEVAKLAQSFPQWRAKYEPVVNYLGTMFSDPAVTVINKDADQLIRRKIDYVKRWGYA